MAGLIIGYIFIGECSLKPVGVKPCLHLDFRLGLWPAGIFGENFLV